MNLEITIGVITSILISTMALTNSLITSRQIAKAGYTTDLEKRFSLLEKDLRTTKEELERALKREKKYQETIENLELEVVRLMKLLIKKP